MKSTVVLVAALVCVLAGTVNAAIITIEPDDFIEGTNVSSVSPAVSLHTTGGEAVYASSIDADTNPDLATTGPLGERVFSRSSTSNNEWYAWPSYYDIAIDTFDPLEWAKDPGGLLITFTDSVNWFSLLFAELFPDAGCCDSDPTAWYVYDSLGQLLSNGYVDGPVDGYLGSCDYAEQCYPYWQAEYSHHDIKYVVVGGESEPVTIDRLVFQVPAPGSLCLLALGMVCLRVARCHSA